MKLAGDVLEGNAEFCVCRDWHRHPHMPLFIQSSLLLAIADGVSSVLTKAEPVAGSPGQLGLILSC